MPYLPANYVDVVRIVLAVRVGSVNSTPCISHSFPVVLLIPSSTPRHYRPLSWIVSTDPVMDRRFNPMADDRNIYFFDDHNGFRLLI